MRSKLDKKCPRCGLTKPRSDFGFRRVDGYTNGYCHNCAREKSLLSYHKYKNNPEWNKRNNLKNHRISLKRYHGITESTYNDLVLRQNGLCAICKNRQTRKRLAIDHCCKTRFIRGLLCDKCNRRLGYFQHDSVNLIRAANYLLKSNTMIKSNPGLPSGKRTIMYREIDSRRKKRRPN